MRFPRLPFHLRAGKWGEDRAGDFLKAKGYKILGRRVRIGVRDELDLVARQGDLLVFIEVKTRGSEDFGRPIAAVDRRKQHTLSRAAVRYLVKLKAPVSFRFDVMEVIGREDDGRAPVVRHIENAFQLDRCYQLPW
jgi:putative endonuclease